MYAFLIVIHVLACFVLIAVILLQAGRGGGLSDAIGSGQPQSILGTQTNVFMTRATEACAVIFIITSLSLGIITTQRGKSLMEKEMLLREVKKNLNLPKQNPNVLPQVPPAVPQAVTEPVVQKTTAASVPAKEGNVS